MLEQKLTKKSTVQQFGVEFHICNKDERKMYKIKSTISTFIARVSSIRWHIPLHLPYLDNAKSVPIYTMTA
jgi:hypothetical protein